MNRQSFWRGALSRLTLLSCVIGALSACKLNGLGTKGGVADYGHGRNCAELGAEDYLQIGESSGSMADGRSSQPKERTTATGLMSWRRVDGLMVRWTDWEEERAYRQYVVNCYVQEARQDIAKDLGFSHNQTPKLAWKWFEEAPVGFVGVPYVLLKTILDLRKDANCPERAQQGEDPLCPVGRIWQTDFWRELPLSAGANIDHIGLGPHPRDYINGVYSADKAKWPLPYGLVFQGGNAPGSNYVGDQNGYLARLPGRPGQSYEGGDSGPYSEPVESLNGSLMPMNPKGNILDARISDARSADERIAIMREALITLNNSQRLEFGKQKIRLGATKAIVEPLKTILQDTGIVAPSKLYDGIYADDVKKMGRSPGLDNVFFSCAACHSGRVQVDGKMMHMPGSPNTEVEAQYYSELLMRTGAALTLSGADVTSTAPIDPKKIQLNFDAISALQKKLITKAIEHPESFYGSSPEQIIRGQYMAMRVASDFFKSALSVVGTAVKTHFIYSTIAHRLAYKPSNGGKKRPALLGERIGAMDAFGIASGLVAIHTKRPDHSFMKFVYRDDQGILGDRSGQSPAFQGFPGFENTALGGRILTSGAQVGAGMPVADQDVTEAERRIFDHVDQWAPRLPAPIDIKSLNLSKDHKLANWDGNQGAAARTLASGTSATGDPRLTNVEIHEPLNPFINSLPPTPYPFAIDAKRAEAGAKIFVRECAGCHRSQNAEIYTAAKLGVDENRSVVNTSVSRNLLAALVLEGCTAFVKNTGNDYCLPDKSLPREARLADLFQDTPARVAAGKNGYKADVLHGIWTQAPYLHNGSVPTLAHLLCPAERPTKFVRGNVHYDTKLVGFEWDRVPQRRYSRDDVVLAKWFDSGDDGRSNGGHEFGKELCDGGIDNLQNSAAGDLLEYLKTL